MADSLPTTEQLPELDISRYNLTPKFERWKELYLDQKNKETFGNATECALQAYMLDRQTQYGSARVVGHENLTKLNNLRLIVRSYLEDSGFTLPVLVNHALQMMADPKVKTSHWWKEILSLAGYIDPKAAISIKNTASAGAQAAATSESDVNFTQISKEEERELSREFADFVDQKYRGKPAMNPDAPTS